MAAVAVFAELKSRDGSRQKINVKVENNNLSSLISAIRDLNDNVSRALSALVEREKPLEDPAQDDEEDSDEEGDGLEKSQLQPPAKRSKT